MTKTLNYLWRGWLFLLAGVLLIIFFLPVYLLSIRKEHYQYAYFFIRTWCLWVFYGMGFRYDLVKAARENIDRNRQYVIVANHTSIMDVMLVPILFPHHPVCFVGKKELVKIPIFGSIYKRICVMVDRKSAKSRAEVYIRCAERMEGGESMVIFPEGGVPDDTTVVLDQFKDGAFTLSRQHGVPVAVFTIVGLKEMFPFDNSKGHPGTVKVFFNGILGPTEDSSVQKSAARGMILETLLRENTKPA